MVKGDFFVKLSLIWWGAGYARRKQFVKALIMTLLEAGVIYFTLTFAMDYVPKFGTLGTVKAESYPSLVRKYDVDLDSELPEVRLIFKNKRYTEYTDGYIVCFEEDLLIH